MLNGYSLRPVRKKYPTFTAFMRAYCTPLQPHLTAQVTIERHRRWKTNMVEVSPGKWQLARHVRLQKRAWPDLPDGARAIVLRVFRGQSRNIAGNATRFLSTDIYFRDRHRRRPTPAELARFTEEYASENRWRWVRPHGADIRVNCFFEERAYQDVTWPAVVVLRLAR
jgi:hypothetical protein